MAHSNDDSSMIIASQICSPSCVVTLEARVATVGMVSWICPTYMKSNIHLDGDDMSEYGQM